MNYELSEVKILRKKMGITQAQLAARCGVSQSLIAKLEAGALDPSYTIAMRIFRTLDEHSQRTGKKAFQLMHKKLISVGADDRISDAVTLMRKHGISQLPVISAERVVGIITETSILDALLGRKASRVGEVMQEAPPIVNSATPAVIVLQLLHHSSIVIVQDSGKIAGVITKSDVIGAI